MKEYIYYREREYIDKYKCRERIESIFSFRSFIPEKTNLLYCCVDRFNYKTIGLECIVDRVPASYENVKTLLVLRYDPKKKMYFFFYKTPAPVTGYISTATGKYIINKMEKLAGDNLIINIENILEGVRK